MDDPVTLLLSQWMYQAMVHELLGLNNNCVVLCGAPGVKKDLEEVVLSSSQDEFFWKNQHANFGELGEVIKPHHLDVLASTQPDPFMHLTTPPVIPLPPLFHRLPPTTSPLAHIDIYVDNFIDLAQMMMLATRMMQLAFHTLDRVFHP